MTQAMTSDFMTTISHAANERGMLLGYPTECKESSFAARSIEQIQQYFSIRFDATLLNIPLGARYPILKRTDVKVIFEINRECIFHKETLMYQIRAQIAIAP